MLFNVPLKKTKINGKVSQRNLPIYPASTNQKPESNKIKKKRFSKPFFNKKNQKFRSYNIETYRCPTPEETYKKKTRNALENVSLKKINKKIK